MRKTLEYGWPLRLTKNCVNRCFGTMGGDAKMRLHVRIEIHHINYHSRVVGLGTQPRQHLLHVSGAGVIRIDLQYPL